MTFVEKLNRYGVNAFVNAYHKPDLEAVPADLDDLCDSDGNVVNHGLAAFLDVLDDQTTCWIDTHPEGHGGGKVFYAEHDGQRAFYNENEGEWEQA